MNDSTPKQPPPQPPPHNENSRNGLPPGNYDIFIIPPHSSGSGFLYLPSLQPHRNSFLAGVGSTVLVILIWISVVPVLKQWLAHVVASGSVGIAFLLCSVGLLGWLWGQWQMQQRPAHGNHQGNAWNSGQPPPNAQNTGYANSQYSGGQSQWGGEAPPNMNSQSQNQYQRTSPSGAGPDSSAKSGWEKAREETRRREEERKRMDELRKKAEELKKKREEDEKVKLAQREKETREREARERREKLMKEREQRKEQEASESKNAKQPTARDEADEEQYSYRPYDKPKPSSPKAPFIPAATAAQRAAGHNYNGSSSSKAHSTYSFAQTHSTSKTTPPHSTAGGPYQTKDPDKIVLKAVYSFNDTHVKTPIAQLVSGVGAVTDGLILRITSEGLFIDDDVRAVPQREWDVKAWTMKGVETGSHSSTHIIRASIRDTEGKRYVFILRDDQGWKLPGGISRLKKGSTVRQLAIGALGEGEVRSFLESRGWA